MAEQIDHEILQETSCFLVTKEAGDRAIAEIAEDPDRAMMEEGEIIETTNPELNLLLRTSIREYEANIGAFSEGALWTHRILRKQAEMRKTNVPQITPDLKNSYVHDRIEDTKLLVPNENMGDYAMRQAEKMTAEEPQLSNALKELFKYRAGKSHLYAGAVSVYFPIKNALQARGLENKLGL